MSIPSPNTWAIEMVGEPEITEQGVVVVTLDFRVDGQVITSDRVALHDEVARRRFLKEVTHSWQAVAGGLPLDEAALKRSLLDLYEDVTSRPRSGRSPRPSSASHEREGTTVDPLEVVHADDEHDTESVLAHAPVLPNDVWVGWLRDFRSWVEPTTDGAFEAIFVAGAIVLGLAVGREVALAYGRPMYANLNGLILGQTGVPRKTTVMGRGREILERIFDDDTVRVSRSIGSGEGLLELFCEEVQVREGRSTRTILRPLPKQRVLLDEPEWTNVLVKLGRSGTANLQEILIALYDGEDFTPRTRSRPITVREPFFSILTATTPENLETRLDFVHIESGLVPRFVTFWATPREPIAYPDVPDKGQESKLVAGASAIFQHAHGLATAGRDILELSPAARNAWAVLFKRYTDLQRQTLGPAAHILTRVPSHVLKFALLYCLQAGHAAVELEDLERAAIVGDYLAETAVIVPRGVTKAPIARVEAKVLDALQHVSPRWVGASRVHQIVGGRIDSPTLQRALGALVDLDRVEQSHGASPGHPEYRVYRLRSHPSVKRSNGHPATGGDS
ncbi:MAG TPA: DUF3987 domain-containing protein [Candidatus Micrarchaeia archaeon]|nr:DUF3987 domain-containing protein [Candidatus Micrarchaeia archaeon]